MNKFKGLRLGKGKADIRKIGAAVVATMLVVAMVIGLLPSDEVIAAEKLSDYGTETKYTESLGDNASTEYAGRIWTDKSVYTDDTTFDAFGGAKYTVENDSDFLVGFSALATAQSVSGQAQAPIDVVFIIDISGSMSNNDSGMDNGKSRIYNTIQAVNDSIDKLMSLNKYSRVAVVAFSSNAQVLLPLDRYTKTTTTESEWVSTGRHEGYWKETEVTHNYFSLSHETATNNNVTLYTRATGTENTISKDTSVSGGTNIQMGFYEGMNVLATEANTTATMDGKEVTRVPSVILLSDGAPTFSSDSKSWWAPSDNSNDGPGSTPYAGNGMKALMTASYMKDAIDRNYKVANTTSKTRVYTVGMGITDLSTNEKSLAYMTLDPGTYWETENNTADSTIVNSTMASTIRSYWSSYIANNNTGTVNVNVGKRNNNNSYSDDYYGLTHPTTGYEVASIKDYVDDYYDANSASGVTDVFNDIVNSISISTPEVPTEHDTANPLTSGYITYTDPIGEYMEVKALKSIIYAGKEYTSVSSHREGSSTDYIDTYVFAGSVEGNPVYGTHDLKEITIQVHTVVTNGIKKQTMTIKVPAAAIPLRVNTVTLNSDGTVKSHTNNGAFPLRVLYTVGLQDEVKSDGHINSEKLTAEYIEANSNDDGTINFYSNLYTGTNEVNGKTAGDATVEFEPAHTNSFYYMQENTPIYTDEACTQIAEAPAELVDDQTYYYKETYYHGNTVVKGAIERTGAQLNSVGVVNINGQWYRPEGSPRLNRVLKFEGTKIDNNTDTAEDFYAPTFVQTGATPYEGKFVIYLGNNGVMSAVASGTLDITKTVTADDGLTAPDKSFTFTVNLKSSSGTALTGVYTYKVLDAAGNAVVDESGNAVTGTITDGGTLTLKAGQTARIVNLPPDAKYTVTETAVAGFTTTVDEEVKNTVEGTITAGQISQETFVNHYSIEESLVYPTESGIQGAKILDGRDWKEADKFTFTISSANNAPLPENARVVLEGKNAEDGEQVLFDFGQITFTAPGTYYYTIVELTPGLADEDRLPGVSYTKEAYDVVVTVIDNGDGTLAVDQANTKMTKVLDRTGQKVSEVISDNVAVFTNTYSATSVYFGPVATKTYTDNSGVKPLTDGMFTFEMKATGDNASEAPMPDGTENGVYTAKNVGEFISFSQMEFKQDYANKVFTYELREVIPADAVDNGDGTYTLNGMTYDASVVTVTVEVTLEGAAVKITPTYKDAQGNVLNSGVFTNVYTPTPVVLGDDTNAPIQGKKILTGRNMKDEEVFTFTLEAADAVTTKAIEDNVVTLSKTSATVAKGEDGKAVDFDFEKTTLTKPGIYTFNVKETAGDANGVTYDNHVCTVTVVVTDNDGKLEAAVTYDNGADATDNTEAVFVNEYEPTFDAKTAVTLTGKKQLTGQTLLEGEFYFSVEPQGNAPVSLALDLIASTGDSEADENGIYEGDITFLDNVTYTEAGTYTYLIRETIPEQKRGGMTYDESVYRVTVMVSDVDADGNAFVGVLRVTEVKVEKSLDGGKTYTSVGTEEIVFKNTYVPNPVTVTPYEMTKVLVGKRMKDGVDYPLQAGEFEFEKIIVSANPADGVILPNPSKITNDADGKVQFNKITFTKAGTYVIQIREVIPEGAKDNGDGTYTLGAITYDTHVVQSTFKVTDDENGTLTVVRTSTIGSREFRNEYKSDGTLEGATNLKVTKNFTGRAWEDGDSFTFILEGKNEATNTAIAEGKVVLPNKTEITIDYDDKEKSKAFGDIVFYEAGTYEFGIREAVPEEPIPGVDYDATSRTIVVTAVDNGTGKLTVTATGGTNPTFNNNYNPQDVVLYGHGNLHVVKTFTGRENDEWLAGDVFKFTITPKAGVTADAVTASNIIMPTETTLTVNKDNKEYAHFGNITFKKVGEYEFVVTEEVGNIPGVTYTTVSKTVKVNVTNDSKNGVLLVAVDEQSDSLEFINTYGTTPATLDGSTYLKVTKALSGRNWYEEDKFTFTLGVADDSTEKAVEAGDVVLPSEKELTVNKTEMLKAFGDITFKKPGAYAFTIKEVQGDIDGVTYDGHTTTVAVMVVDNKEGQLVIANDDVVTTGSMTWTNVYTPDPIKLSLNASKEIAGRDWDAEKDIYTFGIVAIGDNGSKAPLPENKTVQNAANGEITFGEITYTEAGTYKYEIFEINSNVPGVTTDKGYVVADVTVTNNEAEGKLESSVVYTKVNGATLTEGDNKFVNTYSSTGELDGSTYLKVTKDFTGRPNDEWLDTDVFTFKLAADTSDEATQAALKDNQIVMPTEDTLSVNKNNRDNAHFGNIKFTKAGTYKFIVNEVIPEDAVKNADGTYSLEGITYDATSKTVSVTVVDNWDGTLTATANNVLVFENVYSAKGILDGSTYLEVTKNFTGRTPNAWLDTDSFTFVLESADAATAKAVKDGHVVMPANKDGITINGTMTEKTAAFGNITFTKEGTYKFIIREVKPTPENAIKGVEYDGTPREITVVVKDNGNATMSVVSTITSGTSLTFNNVYKTGEITLSGHNNLHVVKNLTGRGWVDTDAFEFTLTADTSHEDTKAALDAENIVMPERSKITVTKDNKDRIHFGDITFKAAGTYQFIVKEEIPDDAKENGDGSYTLNGVTYDTTSRVVKVSVEDNGDSTLTASLADGSETLEFTNVYDAGSVTLKGSTYLKVTKKLTGRDWFETDEFEFTLEAADDVTQSEIGKSIIMPTNKNGITIDGADKDKEAAFEDIIFTEMGTYKFIIQEVIPEETNKIDGITYDSHKVTVEVVVTDNHKGQLVAATPVYSGSMEFENVYTPDSVVVDIKGWKTILDWKTKDSRELRDSDKFEFTISVNSDSPSNIPMPDKTIVTNSQDGAITFGTITYAEAGTYVYDIKETGGSAPGVTNDTTVITATVVVDYDASTGVLTAKEPLYSVGENKGFVFKNTYKADPTDSVTIFNAKKTVTPSAGNSYTMKGDEFKFTITPADSNPESDPIAEKTVSNDKKGNVIFVSDVKYTECGTYKYTVKEESGNLGGMSYDSAVYEITVEVTDNKDTAKLSAEVTITKDGKTVNAITFDNGYNPEETTTSIDGKKKLTGSKEIEAGEFSFTIAKAKDSPKETPMPAETTVKNDAAGEIRFGAITYTVPGEYSYIISEVNEGKTGYTYDDATYTVTVKVTDENGKLKAEVSKEGAIVFNNEYEPNPIILKGETAIKGTKKLDGRTMKADEFTFQLIGEDSKVVLESKNDADGNFTFEPLTYTKEGTYKYTIVEKNTGLGGVTYDTNSYAVTVEVTDVDGNLTAKVSYYDEDEQASVVFKNTYVAQPVTQQITATKKLTGRDLKAGEFTFVLKNEAGEVVKTAKNDANGVIIFEGITYDKAGTYKYTISEEKGQTEYVTYDESVYKVTVTVKDGLNGHMEASVEYEGGAVVFTNSYREPVVPTNDTIFSGGYVVTALIALATAVVAFFKRKRIVK